MKSPSFAEAIADLPPNAPVIGLDLGSKTIGVAISDITLKIASPIETIARKKFTDDARRLLAIAGERRAGLFVLGLPLNMDGSEGPRAQSTRAFARNLRKLTPLPIVFLDETLTNPALEATLVDAATRR